MIKLVLWILSTLLLNISNINLNTPDLNSIEYDFSDSSFIYSDGNTYFLYKDIISFDGVAYDVTFDVHVHNMDK